MKCESGALSCLREIGEQIESKRVLIFGLRSLVEYLSTRGRGSGQFVDNVLGCVDAGLTGVLVELNKRYGATDDDLLLHLVKVVGAVTRAFAIAADQPGAAQIIQKSIDEGYEPLLRELVDTTIQRIPLTDSQFWQVLNDPLLAALQPLAPSSRARQILRLEPATLQTLESRLGRDKKVTKAALHASALLAFIGSAPAGEMPYRLLENLQQNLHVSQATEDVAFAADVLAVILSLLGRPGRAPAPPTSTDDVLAIMESMRDRKGLQETLARILALLVGPEELAKVTEALVNESSLKSLKVLSALGRASGGSAEPRLDLLAPVARIIHNFDNPADASQYEGFTCALGILRAQLETSASKVPGVAADLTRIASLPDLRPEDLELIFSVVNQLFSSGQIQPSEIPAEFLHTVAQTVSSSAAPAEQALRFAAALAAREPRLLFNANVPATAVKRLTELLAQPKKSAEAIQMVGPIAKLHEAILGADQAAGLEALAPVAQTLKAMKPDDRYAFEMTLPYLQRVCGYAKSDPSLAERLAAADVAAGVLRCSIAFADYPHIVKACEAVLRATVSGADLSRAVATLTKLSKEPKANLQTCLDACATIHGVASISAGAAVEPTTLENLAKAVAHEVSAPPFAGQSQLVLHTLACIKALAARGGPLGEEPHRLLAAAASAGARAVSDAENSAGGADSSVTEIIKCATALIALDRFDSGAPLEKCVGDVSTLMRKYPEQRKTQTACLELFAALVSASAQDVTPEFLKSGVCKQLLSTMTRGSAIQEYQAAGLRVILAVARRRPENPDGLRRAGVIEVLRRIAEHYQAKPDVLKLCQQAQALLMPQEQTRDDVLSQIEALSVAARHRDVRSGGEALGALAGLTAAADAAKFAARNGMGAALTTFFDAMRAGPPAAGEDLQVCSLGAVQTLRNVGSVGRPHSTLMLKGGAVPLLLTILQEAAQHDGPVASQVVAQCLEASRSLLANESNPAGAAGAAEFTAAVQELLPTLLQRGDARSVTGAVAALGLLASDTDLAENSTFVRALPNVISALVNAATEEDRVDVLRCIFQMAGRRALLVQRFAEAGGVEAVIRCLDTYGSDESKTAVWCRKVLERLVATTGDSDLLRTSMLRRGGTKSMEYALKALGRNLGTAADLDTNSAMLGMLCRLTAHTDKRMLRDLGIMETVQSAVELNALDNPLLKGMLGDLLTNLGGDALIAQYFERIIALCDTARQLSGAGPLCRKHLAMGELGDTLRKLENFVFCSPEDPHAAFGAAPRAMTALAEWLPLMDLELSVQTSQLMLSMCRRFQGELDSPYGVQAALQSGFISRAIGMLNSPSCELLKAPAFLAAFYETLILGCSNELAYDALRKTVVDSNFLERTWLLLQRYENDADVATPIIGFLGHFTRSSEAAAELEAAHAAAATNSRELRDTADAATTIWNMIWTLRRNGQSVGAGLDALGMVTRYTPNSKLLARKSLLHDRIRTLAAQAPEAACGYAGFALCHLDPDAGSDGLGELYDDLLEVLVKQYYKIKDDDSVEREVRDRLLRRLASVVEAIARRGDYHLIRKSKVIPCLVEAAKCEMQRKQAVHSLLRATYHTREDQQAWTALAESVIPAIASTLVISEEVRSSQDCSRMLVGATLPVCLGDDDCKRMLQEVPELLSLVAEIEAAAAAAGAEELRVDAARLRELLEHKLDEKLTLEIVYKRWRCRVDRQQGGYEILNLGTGAGNELLAEFDFVIRETQELASHPQKSVASNPVAREMWFGCHCLALAQMLEINCWILTSGLRAPKIQEWTLAALKAQPLEESVQAVCRVVNNGAKTAPAEFAAVADSAAIITDSVRRATNAAACREGLDSWRVAKVVSEDQAVESWLIERLTLMAALCKDRCFYNETEALDVLKFIITLTQNPASGYTVETAKAVLKVLRAMANEQICAKFIELQFPEYLLQVVDSPASPKDLLADALMVIGFMASFILTKNYFGRLEGIQRIVALLKRLEKEKASGLANSRVQQNACLAIGNLVLGHARNGTAFGKEGGVDLAIRILNAALAHKVDYDLANAVCVLMSNCSFKRDDFKEAFGKSKGCLALLQCLKRYDGSDCPAAFRCLNSMFKAVGNLALIPNNVQRFLDGDISKCLQTFYEQDGAKDCATVPDDLLFVSLKTLANLTLENAEAFMLHFGAILKPLISLIASGKHNTPALLAFVCETFASLCRNAENRATFIKCEGIERVVELVNQNRGEQLYLKALELFAVLAKFPNAAERLANSGIFSFILGVLDECEELDALTIVEALRVLRRLASNKTAAAKFIEASPMPLLGECLKAAAPYADRSVPSSQTVKEICHIVLVLLAMYAPSTSETAMDLGAEAQPRDVPWADEILTGAGSIVNQQFSRIFSRRVKSNRESESSAESEDTPSDEQSIASTEMHSIASEEPPVLDDDAGSPVDLHTPPLKKKSTLEHSNMTQAETLHKPKGERGYQKIGLEDRTLITMNRALFVLLATGGNDCTEDGTLRLDKLSDFALMLLAYTVCEKVDGCGLVFANCSSAAHETLDFASLIEKIFAKTRQQKSPEKLKLLHSGAEIVANACACIDPNDLQSLCSAATALDALRSSASALTKSNEQPLRRRIEDIWTLLSQTSDQSRFLELVTYNFPLSANDLAQEEYANGVQDLPTKVRTKIRRGGRNKCLTRNNAGKYDIQPLWWKSSSDMLTFRYMTDKNTQNYDNQIAISHARRIVRGAPDNELKSQLSDLKIKARHIVSICGTDSPPLHLVFRNRLKASRMYERIAAWHAAATR